MYTFETLLHQELGKVPTKEDLCKSIQRILERVLKVSGSAPALDLPQVWPSPASSPGGRRRPPSGTNEDAEAEARPPAFHPPARAGATGSEPFSLPAEVRL